MMLLAAAADAAGTQFGFGPHEPYSLLDSPMMLIPPILLYSLVGIPVAFLLNQFLSKFHISLRLVVAGICPLLFWVAVITSGDQSGVSFVEGLRNLLAFAEIYVILLPGVALVASVCFLDNRRSRKSATATRFAENP